VSVQRRNEQTCLVVRRFPRVEVPSRIATRKGFVRDADAAESLAGNAGRRLESSTTRGRCRRAKPGALRIAEAIPFTLAHSPILARSAGRGSNGSSPAPRTRPSVQDRNHNTLEPSDRPKNLLAPPPEFLFEQR
jgi:hypothetical protein